jgi:putative transcriptional regulator
VVLLAEHTEEGSFGIILNKPVNLYLNEITEDFPGINPQIYIGGPVDTNNIFIVHKLGDKIPGSIKIAEGLFWGGDMELIKTMIRKELVTEDDIRFYLGYSGWTAKQLDEELKDKSWLVTDFEGIKIDSEKPENLWKGILVDQKNEYSQWVNYPLDPSYN